MSYDKTMPNIDCEGGAGVADWRGGAMMDDETAKSGAYQYLAAYLEEWLDWARREPSQRDLQLRMLREAVERAAKKSKGEVR